MVAFVLSLISIVLMFFNEILGLIFAIIALVIGRAGVKTQEKWAKPAVAVSVVSIIIFVVILLFSFVKVNNAQQQLDKKYEEYDKAVEQLDSLW